MEGGESMYINCPCKDCVERHFCCHASCTKYAAYRTELTEQKQLEKADNELNNFNFAVKKQLMKKGANRMYYSANKKAR